MDDFWLAPLTQIGHVDCDRHHTTRHALTAHGCDGRAVTTTERKALLLAALAEAGERMPRDALTLSDVRGPTLTIVCAPCGRRGRYRVARLIAKHGEDGRLPELLRTIADCPKARAHSFSIYDRCKARYEGL